MNLFNKGEVTLSSGLISDFKIDCDALSDEDIECLAHLISKKFSFYRVEAVPTGGNRLAKALEKYANRFCQEILIVDDVLTTGNSMERIKKEKASYAHHTRVKGVVVFARGECPNWIYPIFQMKII